MRDRSHRGVETTARAILTPANDDPLPFSDEREAELRQFGAAARKRRTRRHEIGAIRAKLRASAAGHVAQAAAQVSGREASACRTATGSRSPRRSVEPSWS
jgi:hypothetical protein